MLAQRFYPLYRRLFDPEGEFVTTVEQRLAESRLTDTVEMFLSRALAIGVLTGLALWLLGIGFGYGLFAVLGVDLGASSPVRVTDPTVLALWDALEVPLLVFLVGLVFGSLGFAAGFGSYVLLPYSKAAARKREINMLLSDAVSYMYALSVGGLNQIEILQAMAMAEDTYGEVAREFQSIVQETEYFDTDYRTAIRNQAVETPSDELGQFLTDMLSIINSGGDLQQFLDDQKEKHMRTAKQQQETILETLELFGEMYMTLSLFPLLLIVVLVIMTLLGQADPVMLYLSVYGLIPLIGLGFLVLIATAKWDEPGEGYLHLDEEEDDILLGVSSTGLFNRGIIESFVGEGSIFDHIKRREGGFELVRFLTRPHHVFRDHPTYTFAVTVPLTAVFLGSAIVSGAAPTSWSALVARPVWGTFVYVYLPVYVVFTPFAVFHLWNLRSRRAVLVTLANDLRKLSSANDTGLTLLESIRLVADTSSGKLASEFEIIYAKVKFGMSLKEALVAFNNTYHIPELARTVRLVTKSQEASNHITAVLRTAAQVRENHDDIAREQKARTRMQVVVIVMSFLTLLTVMAVLKTQFIDVMADLTASTSGSQATAFASSVDSNLLSLLFFHAVTVQAILAGLMSGFIRESDLLSGAKYVIGLMTVALLVWLVVG
nr:type II secretion system F family protein [Halorarius litoreus]